MANNRWSRRRDNGLITQPPQDSDKTTRELVDDLFPRPSVCGMPEPPDVQ